MDKNIQMIISSFWLFINEEQPSIRLWLVNQNEAEYGFKIIL